MGSNQQTALLALAEARAAQSTADDAAANGTYPGELVQTPTAFADPGIVYNDGDDWSGTIEARLTSDGRVWLRGAATRAGSTGFGTPIATLPAGFRPAQSVVNPVGVTGAANSVGLVQEATNGEIVLVLPQSTTNDPTSIFVDGISFSIF